MVSFVKQVMLAFSLTVIILGTFLVESSGVTVTHPDPSGAAPEVISVIVRNDPEWNEPITTMDPYTGAVSEYMSGKFTRRGTIEVTIKEVPFTPYTDEDGNYIRAIHSVSVCPQYLDDWEDRVQYGHSQSDSVYTVVTFKFGVRPTGGDTSNHLGGFATGSLLDFRVRRCVGYYYRPGSDSYTSVFVGEVSEWSEPITVSIPPADEVGVWTFFASGEQRVSQRIDLETIVVATVCIVVIVLTLSIIMYRRKINKNKNKVLIVAEKKVATTKAY
ncbi:MAG: hypothetical protein LBE76_04905 [Nitrososphaerota archaeon]|jgi:hypothetical protein|nr:hypothetical protein [Nitrososphaerota archaeon]